MITIKHTDFTSNVSLPAMLMVRTKEYMLQLVDEFVKAGSGPYRRLLCGLMIQVRNTKLNFSSPK